MHIMTSIFLVHYIHFRFDHLNAASSSDDKQQQKAVKDDAEDIFKSFNEDGIRY